MVLVRQPPKPEMAIVQHHEPKASAVWVLDLDFEGLVQMSISVEANHKIV